jgi:hypothetical protein
MTNLVKQLQEGTVTIQTDSCNQHAPDIFQSNQPCSTATGPAQFCPVLSVTTSNSLPSDLKLHQCTYSA